MSLPTPFLLCHCLQADVEGAWLYELAQPVQATNHDSLRSACEFNGNVVETLQLSLLPETKVDSPGKSAGFWTMVEDGVSNASRISCLL